MAPEMTRGRARRGGENARFFEHPRRNQRTKLRVDVGVGPQVAIGRRQGEDSNGRDDRRRGRRAFSTMFTLSSWR